MNSRTLLAFLSALLCTALVVVGQEVIVFNEDETEVENLDSLLESEHFLTADKTWRSQAQPLSPSLEYRNNIGDADAFSSLEISDSISKNNKVSSTVNISSPLFTVPSLLSGASSHDPSPLPSQSSPSSSSSLSSAATRNNGVSREKTAVGGKQENQPPSTPSSRRSGNSASTTVSISPMEKALDSVRWETIDAWENSDGSDELADDWLGVEELYVPINSAGARDAIQLNEEELDWGYGPSLSRHRRDLVPGSGEIVVKLQKTLSGVLTTAQATDGTTENAQLKSDLGVALDTYLSASIPNSVFQVEVTAVSAPNITVEAQVLFTEGDVTLTQIATALVNLDMTGNYKVGSSIYGVDSPLLEPSTNAALLPAICFLCTAAETCSQNTVDQTWFCAFNDTRFYPHGTAQGDGTLPKGDEFATAKITFESTIPYQTELLSDLWISVNGLISFEEEFASFAPESLPFENRKLLAVYWSDLDLFVGDTAEVYYQLYTKTAVNTASELEVLTKANVDVVAYTEETVYDATSVLVVTWDGVPPWPALASLDERVTFQAAIISDGSTTYVMYIYGQGGMNFDPILNRDVVAGWFNINLDTTANYYVFDTVIGNTGNLGMWIVQLGSVINYRNLCVQFFQNSLPLLPALNFYNLIIPQCPCRKSTAESSFFWLPARDGDPNCYDMFPIFGQIGRRCCYRADGSEAFENRIPDVGPLQLFTPYYGDAVNHEIYDTDPKDWCCVKTDLCTLYYLVRPVRTCRNRNTRRAFCFGDPHIETIDQRQFIFNGLGEYTIMEIDGVAPDNVTTNFVLQGRTCLATASSGNLTDATVWCALAMQNTNGSSLRVTVHESGSYMVIYINSQDYTVRFRENSDFSANDGDLYIRKINGSLTVSTPDSIGMSISLQSNGVLDFAVELDEKFQRMTRGLLGNFNDDPTDDFILPNGTRLSNNSSERELFGYGQAWAISQEQSLFTYAAGQNTSTFTNTSFTPIFLDETSQELRAEAEGVCGGSANLPCLFDYIATRNADLALSTALAINEFEAEEASAANSAPVINGTTRINTVVGQTSTIYLTATDSDNDNFVYVVIDSPSNGTFVTVDNGNTLEAQYTPVDTNPVSIGLVAQDSNNLQSEVTQIDIVTCSGCSDHGTCDYEDVRSTANPYFSVASCVCEQPYSGVDCENDKDGCSARPCPLGTTCSDVLADDEAATGIAYNCSQCPTGYLLNVNRTKCEDINECLTSNPCDANAACTNTLGGYICTCNSGYRKSGANTCIDIDECVENQNQCSQLCENTVGSYSCGCEAGFDLDFLGFSCSKSLIDPCESLANNCSYGCRNVSGEGQCFCPNGFRLRSDNATCEDINECQENLCSQGCTNTNGSYQCYCYVGYTLAVDRLSCDECASNRYGANCSSTCNCRGRDSNGGCDNVKGCLCVPQWMGESCAEDVDECAGDPNLCPEAQVCVNTAGGYRCECPTGYADTYNNGSCYNINECQDLSVSQCPQDCVDNPGSFTCTCRDGYRYFSNNTCLDIDECASGTSGCEQMCVNKEGSYNCACRLGYVLADDRLTCIKREELCLAYNVNCSFACTIENDAPLCYCPLGYKLALDGSTCIDINECENGNLCTNICVNIPGSYNCSCADGTQLQNDQRSCAACDDYHWGPNCVNECACNPKGSTGCDPVIGCTCAVGWAGATCSQDVDECSYETSPCPAFSTCMNNPGSYRCQCSTGFKLSADDTCVDVDECQTSFPCDQNCNNTIGSYICTCEDGFLKNGDGCEDIDECEVPSLHQCEQKCRNTKGGFACECFEGFKLDVTNRRTCMALDISSVCSPSNACSDLCRVENGTDICYCPPGYELDAATSTNCSDINECQSNSSCDATNGQCSNLPGSFSCTCDDGFQLADDMLTCLACDYYRFGSECSQACACNETNTVQCLATNGTCVCSDGWTGSTCSENINECAAPTSVDCGSDARCVDSPGSYRCVCDVGFFKSSSVCTPCDATHYGQDCALNCSCVAANTADCNDTTGICTCKTGWTGVNCSVDIDECSAGDYCPGPNDTCSNLAGSAECPCDSGFYRSMPSDDCQDVNECLDPDLNTCVHPRTCNNTEGSFTCDCKPGYLEDSGSCTVNFVVYIVHVQLAYQLSDVSSRVFDNSTVEFQALASEIQTSLYNYGVTVIGQAILSVTVFEFRQGSVIADAIVGIDQLYSTDPPSDAASLIHSLNSAGSLTVGQSQIAIEAVTIGSETSQLSPTVSKCEVFNQLTTCSSGFACSEVNGVAACREDDDVVGVPPPLVLQPTSQSSDSNYELIIGLGVGIPLFFILAVVVAVLVYMYVKRRAHKDADVQASSSSRSQDRDEPFRSVFATQMATKGSWGAPSRMQMYSPDAYSEAGTSESSGEGKLLKARQTRGGRLDFQDSAWYDNFGAGTDRAGRSARDGASAITPRSPRSPRDESRGAPTDGGGPTSNFSWEYMFKLLEPHKGFEIQRPNLSSSPNPTYTPRNKRPDSMA